MKRYENNIFAKYRVSRLVEEFPGESKNYGNLTEIKCPDDSRIMISKKGWTSVIPLTLKGLWNIIRWGKIESTLTWEEIKVCAEESIEAGYDAK